MVIELNLLINHIFTHKKSATLMGCSRASVVPAALKLAATPNDCAGQFA